MTARKTPDSTHLRAHTNRVLAFDSHHPFSAERSVVLALFETLNSHYGKEDCEGRDQEAAHLYSILGSNGYPGSFIRSTLQQAERRKAQQNKEQERIKENVVVIPYVQGLSNQIKHVLSEVGIHAVVKAQPWKWSVCGGIKKSNPNGGEERGRL